MVVIDAKGKACPLPVILAKKEIDKGETQFEIQVDNPVAVQNLQRLADSQGYQTEVETKEGISRLLFSKGDQAAPQPVDPQEFCPTCQGKNWAVFVGKAMVGEGDPELGTALIRMFFFTLTQSEDLPAYILFMNQGVQLPTQDTQVIEHLKTLAEKGVEILVCGTCLNFYNLTDQLKIGTVSNMYEIVERMKLADKVITI